MDMVVYTLKLMKFFGYNINLIKRTNKPDLSCYHGYE